MLVLTASLVGNRDTIECKISIGKSLNRSLGLFFLTSSGPLGFSFKHLFFFVIQLYLPLSVRKI
uniref:Uncharacterized protein n=1 Tax=Arundo donax TaxID=35708 RepID=A0A0A9FSI2_ARUDO